MNTPLVTIIMPARNVGKYIGDAILSVLSQSYVNWELLIIENGSTDNTPQVIASFDDPRIRKLKSSTTGLSNARNTGLANARGEFVCFLDSDDRLPANSIKSRVQMFLSHPDLTFIDGIVNTYNYDLSERIATWTPSFRGRPFKEMALLIPGCFSGITWMIRKNALKNSQFDTSWTHLEDRLFFLSIASTGQYNYVNEEVYHIRRRPGSLMTNLRALEVAYEKFMRHVGSLHIIDPQTALAERYRFHRMFFRTYIKNLRPHRAARHWLYMLTHKPA